MSEQVKKWYVVRAISGKEKKVKEYLEHEIDRLKLQDYISQILIPTEKVGKGKKSVRKEIIFPGTYLLKPHLRGRFRILSGIFPMFWGFWEPKECRIRSGRQK